MQKLHRFSIWYIILAIWGVLIIQNMLVAAFAIKTIPYSTFLEMLKQKKIVEVAISANEIQGRMLTDSQNSGQGVRFRTVRVGPEIAQLLEEYKVPFKGEVESTFLRDLLSWVIPVFIFIGIWFFMIKRLQNQQPGFMTIGKNKAKIYMENEVGITFNDAAGVDEAKQELVEVIEFLKNPERFKATRREIAAWHFAGRPAGYGENIAGQSGGRRERCAFFQHERLRVCGNVRGPWRRARERPFYTSQTKGTLHHFHR